MKANESSLGDDQYRFHTTRWSVVLLSAQTEVPGFQAAVGDLYRIYKYPLYAYVRRRGHAPEETQDLIQGFFLHLLEHKTLGRADRLKGKFRSFLLGSLQNYLSNEAERARCLKRGAGVEFVRLDLQNAKTRYNLEPIEALTPEKVFAARWAAALLGEAMNRLRQEYATAEKAATFEVLKPFLDVDNSKVAPSYEEAAALLQVSVGSVKTLIHRLRKRYSALVREEIGRTISDPQDVDAEIHELCQALVAAEGWVMP
ncbi:MAG TPA: sigma-70 family RNA polymerase sigma factor [Terrimicrobiaceae bacterium]|nr:sigma-70 family RNA polymerase sigma factor [Terrimicrobiaceae bacterium]